MADSKYSLGHSRKPKGRVGIGGQPVLSWDNVNDIELQPTRSFAASTSVQNTGYSLNEQNRQPVAETWTAGRTKQAFYSATRRKEKESTFGAHVFHSKNAPVKVSVTGEWALQECEDYTNWTNMLMKRGRHRTISDIRKSIGDGQILVYMLEMLASEKIPGVYARPITRAQKLENLQLCMSFMGNRDINLQGIYVGDLIDGNLKSILALCGNLRMRFEGSRANTPEVIRPASSGSTKGNEVTPSHNLMNGLVSHGTGNKDYGADVKPHGNSSGYHSEEYSPTHKSAPPHSDMAVAMPGMMFDPDVALKTTRSVNPVDVIVSTTELDRKVVSQSGIEQRRYQLQPGHQRQQIPSDMISPSVEERLRSLLSTPNPGGQIDEDTEEELMIPPPRVGVESRADDRFDVEERLKSLLDVAADDFSEDDDEEPKRVEMIRELDKIGYVPSHPSEKLRNIEKGKRRKESFTGKKTKQGIEISTPPALRRVQHMRNQPQPSAGQGGSLDRQRKMSVGAGPGFPFTRTTISTADISPSKPKQLQFNSGRGPASFQTINTEHRDDNGERTPPQKGMIPSHSDFLQQVANRLADEVGIHDTTTTTASSASISPAETPMLPALSPSSSVATFMIGSSSESSGMSTPEKNYSHRLRTGLSSKSPRSHSGASTPRRRGRGRTGSSMMGHHSKAKSTNDLEAIRNQIASLESMYSDVLGVLDLGTKESGNKCKDKATALQKSEEMKAGIVAFRKQRSKDIKAVNKRFNRLESHVVTLARSVAHLSSELRSQAAISEDLEQMRKELRQLREWHDKNTYKRTSGVQQSLLYASNLRKVNKLRKFFGEEPPLLVLFLKKLGYERFAPNFQAEQIGVLELPYINEERLQGLGIPLGPRLRIVEEACKLLS